MSYPGKESQKEYDTEGEQNDDYTGQNGIAVHEESPHGGEDVQLSK